MYDHAHLSDSIHLHRKMREEKERIRRKKQESSQETGLTDNLSVSKPGDASEQEADAIAKKIVSGETAKINAQPGINATIQTKGNAEQTQADPVFGALLSSSKGSGQQLDVSTRAEMESKMGEDFSDVKIHTGTKANEMNENVNAKAFTHGQDIYFSEGNYNPSSSQGKELLAHELVHTKQQGEGKVQPMIQRTARASWQEATDNDRLKSMSGIKQWLYKKQQKRLAENKKLLLKQVELPDIERILNISANYHYYTGFPDFGGAPDVTIDAAILNEVKKQYRMTTSPDFWKNMIWKDRNGASHNIGVRFDLQFVPHARAAETQTEVYSGSGLYNTPAVTQTPWDNVLRLGTIDQMQEDMGFNWNAIDNYLHNNNINRIQLNLIDRIGTYTPPEGAPVQYNLNTQQFEMIDRIRSEITRLGLNQTIANTTLGWANNKTVSIDQKKIQSVTTNRYRPADGETYTADQRARFNETITFNANKKEKVKRIASIIVHEIGHNIGMGHSDIGVMNEHAETIQIQNKMSTLGVQQTPVIEASGADFPSHDLQAQNVQLLINRIRNMTTEDPQQRRVDDQVLPDKNNYWDNAEQQMRTLLQNPDAANTAAIFASDVYTSMLAIPYENSQISSLRQAKTINAEDAKILRRVAKTPGFRITLADWNALSANARTHIIAESLRLLGGGPGLTYFETEAEMNQPF